VKKINAFLEKHELLVGTITITLIALFAAIALSSCASRGSLPAEATGTQGLGQQLGSVGEQFTFWGLIASGVGLVCYFIPALSPFRAFAAIVGEAGAGCAIFGGISVWLSENFWILVLACVLATLAWAYYRRNAIRRWLVSGKNSLSIIFKESFK
jgi:hypothetical protein